MHLRVVERGLPQFIKGLATNTRYMGVVGLLVQSQLDDGQVITEIMHLDYESYGLDGYEKFATEDLSTIEADIQRVMGGLGGIFIEVNEKEALELIQTAMEVAPESRWDYPEAFEIDPRRSAPTEMSDLAVDQLHLRLLPAVERVEGWVNYFLMRTIGHDWLSRRALWDDPRKNDTFRQITEQEQTLIRNQAVLMDHKEGQWTYRCTALIDRQNKYQVLVADITVIETPNKKMRISQALVVDELSVSPLEAAMQLRKREHLSVYAVMDDEFDSFFEERFPALMVNDHEAGRLYCEFNKDNRHVEDSVYYLNGDIYAVYYLTDAGQLVISAFEEDKLVEVENRLADAAYVQRLEPVGGFIADTPILYDFVYSEMGNFYEFLNEEDD